MTASTTPSARKVPYVNSVAKAASRPSSLLARNAFGKVKFAKASSRWTRSKVSYTTARGRSTPAAPALRTISTDEARFRSPLECGERPPRLFR